jgi:hypothetical protein
MGNPGAAERELLETRLAAARCTAQHAARVSYGTAWRALARARACAGQQQHVRQPVSAAAAAETFKPAPV